jgi:hypothetical protein
MVEKNEIFVLQYILKNPNDATCHILRLPHAKILVCTTNVIASVVVGTHPWKHIKFPYSFLQKNVSYVVYN